MLKAIHAAEDVQAAREKAHQVVMKLKAMRLAEAVELVEGALRRHAVTALAAHPHQTISLSASCARYGGDPAWLELPPTAQLPST